MAFLNGIACKQPMATFRRRLRCMSSFRSLMEKFDFELAVDSEFFSGVGPSVARAS
jgi:hypothetical protein